MWTATSLRLQERAPGWSLVAYTMCARLRGWPLPVTLQIDAVTRRCRRQVIAWSRRVLGDEMTEAVEEGRPVAARRAVAMMEEALSLHTEEAQLLGGANRKPAAAAAPLPCTPAVARAYLALAVDGGDEGADGEGAGSEGGSGFGMQLERLFNHTVARAKPHRPGQPATQRLLGLQATDHLHAFGKASDRPHAFGTVESDDGDDDDDTVPTRFGVGCRVELLDCDAWHPGTVSALWVFGMCPSCPELHLHAYRILLDGPDGAP